MTSLATERLVGPDYQADIADLRGRYPKVGDDVHEALRDEVFPALRTNPPFPGRAAGNPMGVDGVYKKRIKNTSADRGTRYGFRLIYRWHAVRNDHAVVVAWRLTKLALYDKTEKADLTADELAAVLSRSR